MLSAIVVLTERSMATVSSAFMSSRRARTVLSVPSALGCRETGSGARRARESAGVIRGFDPFDALHSPRHEPGYLEKIVTLSASFYPDVFCWPEACGS